MSESSYFEDDCGRYVIGFTENHFVPSDTNSPTPSDHNVGYNTFAQDYAERTNRGELKCFLDRSFTLDRQRRQSVSKIHNSILDLMFELSERRKVTTPILSKSAMELHRSDSRFSDSSVASMKTSSSLPLIEVQQLPPLIQPTRSMSSLVNDLHGLQNPPDDLKFNNKAKKQLKKGQKKHRKDHETVTTTKMQKSPRHLQQITPRDNEEKETKTEKTETDDDVNETKHDSKNVRFSMGEEEINPKENSSDENSNSKKAAAKWKAIYEKLKNAEAIMRKKRDTFHEYRGRYFSIKDHSSGPKMSYCQSSYQERSDRERMNNIRRRNSSQTNVGPLDFNKLRRQITIGRCKTMFC